MRERGREIEREREREGERERERERAMDGERDGNIQSQSQRKRGTDQMVGSPYEVLKATLSKSPSSFLRDSTRHPEPSYRALRAI